MAIAGGAQISSSVVPAQMLNALERVLIYGSIILIPYDLPVFHEACLPLAILGGVLMLARGDLGPFLAFVRRLPILCLLAIAFSFFAILSLYGNLTAILGSMFQEQSGWWRASTQMVLLVLTFVYSFYLAFCLRRHADWQSMLINAAWWSLPIPIFVGLLQIANLMGVPHLSDLPYMAKDTSGFFRITSVSRESSWFGSYVCVVLPFLIAGLVRWKKLWLQSIGVGVIGVLMLIFFLGFSKSAFAAIATEITVGVAIIIFVWRPWRTIAKFILWLVVLCTAMIAFFVLAPGRFDKITKPITNQAAGIYNLFEPLLLGDTQTISIGTRFGMSDAGVLMAETHPILGVGLGQFGFYAYNYLPLWGLNRETLNWVANDVSAWPSTANIYTRLLAETGVSGAVVYFSFRLLLMVAVGVRLLSKDNPAWWRDLGVFSIMAALVAFDFHRDSFISLDMWVMLGLALACIYDAEEAKVQSIQANRMRLCFGAVVVLAFFVPLGLLMRRPVSYEANAVLIPESSGIIVTNFPSQDDVGISMGVSKTLNPTSGFDLLHIFWASRVVAARLIATQPKLVRAVLRINQNERLSPITLAQYIKTNVTVMMSDNQMTLALAYKNPNPTLAGRFLAATIKETDNSVVAASTAAGEQAARLSRIILQSDLDASTRQTILGDLAAKELQNSFETAGVNASFDYVEQPAVSRAAPSPSPVAALEFIFVLAILTGTVATILFLLWPLFFQSLGRTFVRLLLSVSAAA